MWRIGEDGPEEFFRSGIPKEEINTCALAVTFAQDEISEFGRSGATLLQWYPEKRDEIRDFVPSLLAERDRSSSPFIPPREVGLGLMQKNNGRVFSGLKWKDWGDPEDPPACQPTNRATTDSNAVGAQVARRYFVVAAAHLPTSLSGREPRPDSRLPEYSQRRPRLPLRENGGAASRRNWVF